jgi:hypothetical protein
MFLIFGGKPIKHPNFYFADNLNVMTEPRGVDLKLKYCSEAIRAHPLPYDECSAPEPEQTPPGEHYRHLSLFADTAFNWRLKAFDRMGVGLIFRPGGRTATGFWGFGVQGETNFTNHWTALGRVQTSFNLQRLGRDRLTLAALGGVDHEKDAGTLPQVGLETSLEWRLISNGSQLALNLPFLSARYTIPHSTSEKETLGSIWTILLGVRASFDLFPGGR